ncbi:hypothetical protein A0J61_01805 [Choanephora cucurbitarum]|uniref:Uncharacterized protein n=1 Tax=Choanephora cucurbitarum TaxID=101091 RepID=A0A1C7NM31_9FUNG|nr:hypothetical protein A0J61_01805 [Choanephora cucurbitarum]
MTMKDRESSRNCSHEVCEPFDYQKQQYIWFEINDINSNIYFKSKRPYYATKVDVCFYYDFDKF